MPLLDGLYTLYPKEKVKKKQKRQIISRKIKESKKRRERLPNTE